MARCTMSLLVKLLMYEGDMYVTLTPQQQIALKSLLEAHIDTLQFAWSKL